MSSDKVEVSGVSSPATSKVVRYCLRIRHLVAQLTCNTKMRTQKKASKDFSKPHTYLKGSCAFK
jgi:hypothetical protein